MNLFCCNSKFYLDMFKFRLAVGRNVKKKLFCRQDLDWDSLCIYDKFVWNEKKTFRRANGRCGSTKQITLANRKRFFFNSFVFYLKQIKICRCMDGDFFILDSPCLLGENKAWAEDHINKLMRHFIFSPSLLLSPFYDGNAILCASR